MPYDGHAGEPGHQPRDAAHAAANDPSEARDRGHSLGMMHGERQHRKTTKRPADSDDFSVANDLLDDSIDRLGKRFAGNPRCPRHAKPTGMVPWKGYANPGSVWHCVSERRANLRRRQHTGQKYHRRPWIVGAKVDFGCDDMPVYFDGMLVRQMAVAQEAASSDIVRDMISNSYWRGKSVVVTGGSSGIGRAIGLAAAAAGAKVGLVARRSEVLDDVAKAIVSAGGWVATAACDVTDAEAIARAVALLETGHGPTDVAIASAGIHRESWPLDAITAREVIDTNVTGTINFLSSVLPGMLARKRGHICGLASIAAAVGLPGNAAYCASKAAVVALLESLRLDCVPAGVRVTTAFPGLVDTPMITDEERTHGGVTSAYSAATKILRAIERGHAEVWFPWGTATAAKVARGLPPSIRDYFLRGQPRMRDASN